MQTQWNIEKKKGTLYAEFAFHYQDTYKNIQLLQHKYRAFFPTAPVHSAALEQIKIAYVAHKPYDTNELTLTNLLLEKISQAKKRIYWGCHGIRPPRIFAEYFKNAIERGVKIVLITNSKVSSKTLIINGLMGWMYWECTKHFKYLLENGIEIFEWQKPGAL